MVEAGVVGVAGAVHEGIGEGFAGLDALISEKTIALGTTAKCGLEFHFDKSILGHP